MMFSRITLSNLLPLLLALTTVGPRLVQGADILVTDGFSKCLDSESIKIERMQLRYDKGTNALQFDVAGSSDREQKIEAVLKISAYGRQIEEKRFDPCKEKIDVLCPVPKGVFRANSNITLDPQFAAMIPAIAFQVPDLDGLARLELRSLDTDEPLACVESVVTNGKTADQPAVSYVTAGMAAVALGLSAISAVGAAGAGGSTAGVSPNFGDVMFWFQSIATNGMLTVEYPPVYRSFAKNFAWSTGLIPWVALQKSIDDFRESTGGNKTANGVEFLMNATLVYTKGGMDLVSKEETVTKRALKMANNLFARQTIDFEHTDGVTETPTEDTGEKSKIMHYVDGIQAYVEQMKIPSANTFMTVLLMFGILVATIAVCILLFKVILEIWALFASFPKRLTGFRKRYWSFLAGTIIRIILILYGTWTMYCLYQFTRGDSWGAHVLAALTLLIFTGILGFFIVKIFKVAREVKKSEGTPEALFLNKPYMRKYGLFYDQFKSNFWWVFVPLIVYAFTKAAFIALGDGHGMVQVAGQLGCELVLLVLLVWNRPFNTRSGNVLNIIISVVRVLSVLCILVFVQELGINTDAKTVTGVILIAIQSTLTAVLAVLLAINAIVIMCKDNPHEKRRKELEKQRAEHLAMRGSGSHEGRNSVFFTKGVPGLTNDGKGQYHATPTHDSFYPAPGGGNHHHHHPGADDDVPMQQMHSFHHQRQQHNRSVSTGSGRTVRESLVMSAAMPAGSPYADYRGENHGMYEQYRGASPPGGVVEGYRGAAPRY